MPEYVIEDEGPDHMKTFTAQVRVGGKLYGNGVGRSKKEAEQAAAETAYGEIAAALGVEDDPLDQAMGEIVSELLATRTTSARAARGRGRPGRARAPRARRAPSPPSTSSTPARYAGTRAARPASRPR